MQPDNLLIDDQLKENCRLTRARCAVWLQRGVDRWHVANAYALSQHRREALMVLLDKPRWAAWIGGALSSGRMRSRPTSGAEKDLGCRRLFVFPNTPGQAVLLVGADDLNREQRFFWRILALRPPPLPDKSIPKLDESAILRPFVTGLQTSISKEEILRRILQILVDAIPCEAAYIALRTGDLFRVEAEWKLEALRGFDFLISEHRLLNRMVATQKGIILHDLARDTELAERLGDLPARSAMKVPILLGSRMIGEVAFVSTEVERFTSAELTNVTRHLARIAYAIEATMVFAETTNLLQQMGLLNELALAATGSAETDEIAQRVVRKLRQIFGTDMAAVFLLADNGVDLYEYGAMERRAKPLVMPVKSSFIGYVIEKDAPLRVGVISDAPRYFNTHREVQSALAVPLKYRGKTFGAIGLQSPKVHAFSAQDENLLVVIASYLAGLLENARLYQETRERATNMNLIHRVVQQVVGMTDVGEICQQTAELIAQYFDYEFVMVLLIEPEEQGFQVAGAGGRKAHLLPEDIKIPFDKGICGEVLRRKASYYTNDVSTDQFFEDVSGWEAGSGCCVPLMEGDRIFGLINLEHSRKNAFSSREIVLFESLAGVLSSVILSAQRYQALHRSLVQVQAARDTALDIAGNLELDALLRRVLSRVRDLVAAKGAELGVVDEESAMLRILASESPWPRRRAVEIPLGADAIGKVAATGQALIIDDYPAWMAEQGLERNAPYLTVAAVPLVYREDVIGALAVMDDVTDRVFSETDLSLLELLAPQIAISLRNARLYSELQERIAAQEKAERQLIISDRLAAAGRVSASIAHEINNPLQSIANCLDLISRTGLPVDQQREYLNLAQREMDRLMSTIQHMLDLYRPGARKRGLVDVNALIDHVYRLLGRQLEKKKIKATLDLDPSLGRVVAVGNQIEQVLLNLILNAMEAMGAGGQLTIETRQDEEMVYVRVKDTGPGVPADLRDQIFEPFVSSKPDGTGLGLAVSYGIIEAHGGRLELLADQGEGACFQFKLPLGENT